MKKQILFGLGAFILGGLASFPLNFDLPVRQTAAIAPTPKFSPSQFKNWGIFNGKASSHIHALDAWKLETGSKDVVVAVIDTGVDPSHPDLTQNLWKSRSNHLPASVFGGVLPKNTGPVYGWDFVTNRPNPADDHGHGTHVAGIIGAVANPKTGTSGVAQKVSIMAIKYYSDANPGYINLSNTIKALHYAIDNGAKIVNYSGGGPEYSEAEYQAIKKAEARGVLIVAAAGNEHQNTDKEENFYYPSAYGTNNIISVAATNIQNELLSSSNWGKSKVDVAAPGEKILSTLPGNRYGYMTGTSQATAFVTGVAALLLSKDPTLTPGEIKAIIRSSVDPITGLKEKVASGGRVNAFTALKALEAYQKTKAPSKVVAQKKKAARALEPALAPGF